MLWSPHQLYNEEPFDLEKHLEEAILEVAPALFGKNRIYLDVKKKIGVKGGTRNIPDGYLLDLASSKDPRLYVVEVELSGKDPLKHIAVQILEFSLSFMTTPLVVKRAIKSALSENPDAVKYCQEYALANGFDNVDILLERMILGKDLDGKDRFRALVIIDDLSEELEEVLHNRFRFPVEILVLQRFSTTSGDRLYSFEPFLEDVSGPPVTGTGMAPLDPADIDTIVVPALEDGFNEAFLNENRWYQIRIHSSMIPRIKYIAAYRVAPESAITHIAEVKSIEQYMDTSKYIVYFTKPAETIGPIRLLPGGQVKALRSPRYTSRARLLSAQDLDHAF